jgi:hypothetical protein
MADLFKVLILVCSVQQSPADCQPESAVDVISGPDEPNEIACARDGQAYVAPTPLVVAGETYPKILCLRIAAEQRPGQTRVEARE